MKKPLHINDLVLVQRLKLNKSSTAVMSDQLQEAGVPVQPHNRAHPHAYEWHEGHINHYRPAANAHAAAGLVKNDQAAGVGTPTFAPHVAPWGTVQPGSATNLFHFPYHGRLTDINKMVRDHGYQVYYAGGKYGKPDLSKMNYNTHHLMIYDPTPQSGGDFGDEEYTRGWRQIHELAHALSYPEINQIYGEGRRIGKLGTHRSLNEALRAVHWEWLTMHKQRELSKQLGIHISDEDFNRELNTVMADASHRAIHGTFTEPSAEGFQPYFHKVPLEMALNKVRDAAQQMGLKGMHDTLKKPAPAPVEPAMVKALKKGLPRNERENQINAAAHAVMEDSMYDKGAVRTEHTQTNPATQLPSGRLNYLNDPTHAASVAVRRDNVRKDPYGGANRQPFEQAREYAPSEEPIGDYADRDAEKVFWSPVKGAVEKIRTGALARKMLRVPKKK